MLLRLAVSLAVGLTILAGLAGSNSMLIEALRAPHNLQQLIERQR